MSHDTAGPDGREMRLADEEEFFRIAGGIAASPSFGRTKQHIQHGRTSVYAHALAVAYYSCWLAEKLGVKVNKRELIRGAMLHDYFLYDWHDGGDGHKWHGFTHAGKALENAKRDFILSPLEEDIIARHMFPLNLHPPGHRESALVCMADKVCSAYETAHRKSTPWRPYRLEEEMEAWLKQMK